MEYLSDQVSIMAFGVAGRFWDIPTDEAVATLAVVLHRRTEQGATESCLPASLSDMIHVANLKRAKKPKEAGSPGLLPDGWGDPE